MGNVFPVLTFRPMSLLLPFIDLCKLAIYYYYLRVSWKWYDDHVDDGDEKGKQLLHCVSINYRANNEMNNRDTKQKIVIIRLLFA